MSNTASQTLVSRPCGPVQGTVRPPGDKSISHRALIFGALSIGETRIDGLLEGDDVLRTAEALRACGVRVVRHDDGRWSVFGLGVGGLREPGDVLDMGNSGTGARLLMGVLASHPFTSFMTGDESLRSRPMARIIDPLRLMGADAIARRENRLPLAVLGTNDLVPIEYELPVASAQVKSAVLLAGLNTRGHTSVVETARTRDHTENLLRHFGADVLIEDGDHGHRRITLVGQPELEAADITVPGDPSSAAFPLVAALVASGSDVLIENVGVNPLRDGLFRVLTEMGADITRENTRLSGGEPVADIRVRTSQLRGMDVNPAVAPSMIDEYPVLAVAASFAQGKTVMRGIGELRIKESDRIAAMVAALTANGVRIEEHDDGMTVHGAGEPPKGGASVAANHDHRIAMSALVLGCAARQPVTVGDADTIETSFPGFAGLMNAVGGDIQATG